VVLILRAAVQHNAHALRTPKHGGFDVVKSSRRRFEGARGGVMAHGGWGDEQLRACSLAPGGELAKLSCPSERVFSTCVDRGGRSRTCNGVADRDETVSQSI
jgi:hypothetical protein